MTRELSLYPAVIARLEERGCAVLHEVRLRHAVDLMGVRFAAQVGRRIPPIELLIAVEVEIERVGEAIFQAVASRDLVHESWVAMPEGRVLRMREPTLEMFRRKRVGLLSIADPCRVAVTPAWHEADIADGLRRNLWRRIREGRTAKLAEE